MEAQTLSRTARMRMTVGEDILETLGSAESSSDTVRFRRARQS
jgi:hypothetical protein